MPNSDDRLIKRSERGAAHYRSDALIQAGQAGRWTVVYSVALLSAPLSPAPRRPLSFQ